MDENTDLEDQKWMRIKLLYDQVDRTRGSRGQSKYYDENGNKLTPDEVREREAKKPGTEESETKKYQLNVVDELTWYYEGCARLNYRCSNEHVAHIVLRCHERQFEWKKIPFKPRSYIYNDVWSKMVRKVAELKNKISDEWELFERYDDIYGSK